MFFNSTPKSVKPQFDSFSNEDVTLLFSDFLPANKALSGIPAVLFDVYENKHNKKVGHVDFRLGNSDDLKIYSGHIGYDIYADYRCQGFAQASCFLLAEFARSQEFKEIWITCNPDNYASNRICQKIGAEFVEEVVVPKTHELYQRGDRAKNRYLWDIQD
jgi:predicted acetyltransferase